MHYSGDFQASEVAIECVKFCPEKEPWFVVGTSSGRLAIYDFSASTLRHILKDDADPVVTCRWYMTDSNEMYIIGAGYSGLLKMWDSRSGLPFLVGFLFIIIYSTVLIHIQLI